MEVSWLSVESNIYRDVRAAASTLAVCVRMGPLLPAAPFLGTFCSAPRASPPAPAWKKGGGVRLSEPPVQWCCGGTAFCLGVAQVSCRELNHTVSWSQLWRAESQHCAFCIHPMRTMVLWLHLPVYGLVSNLWCKWRERPSLPPGIADELAKPRRKCLVSQSKVCPLRSWTTFVLVSKWQDNLRDMLWGRKKGAQAYQRKN